MEKQKFAIVTEDGITKEELLGCLEDTIPTNIISVREIEEEKGNCYEANGKIMLDLVNSSSDKDWLICHGTVVGRGEIEGISYGHCWLEFNTDVVFDYSNNNKVVIRREAYYDLGKISNVKKYTGKEFTELIVKNGHWGNFDDEEN